MTILAFDASAPAGSAALVRDGVALLEKEFSNPRGRGGGLFAALEGILAGAGAIERVVVGLGPGSYNGIRSALAAGWGIAAARSVPLGGCSSLLALAEGAYLAAGDARGGQYYFARVEDGRFLQGPELLGPEALLAAVGQAPGRPIFSPAPLAVLPAAEVRFPRAVLLVRQAAVPETGGASPVPLYLKPPKITAPRQR